MHWVFWAAFTAERLLVLIKLRVESQIQTLLDRIVGKWLQVKDKIEPC